MYNLICIIGPTASGKTTLAVRLAAMLKSEIISADSRQIYKGMDLGTGKDLEEYEYNGVHIPYHLIDIVEAGYKYNIFEYQRDFFQIFTAIQSRGITPIMCGGSGMYVESVLKNYRMTTVPINEELRKSLENWSLPQLTAKLATYRKLHNTTSTDTVKRAIRAIEIEDYYLTHPMNENPLPALSPLIIGVDIDRDLRREKITRRLHQRLKNGMVDEVRHLLNKGISPDDLIYYGLEYKFLTKYIIGQMTYDEMVEHLNIAIHQFAKRQMTWFRKMERSGFNIHWVNAQMDDTEKMDYIMNILDAQE